jgi:hypothetical protein
MGTISRAGVSPDDCLPMVRWAQLDGERWMSATDEILAVPSGARFFRADLHIHSYKGSHDVKDTTMTPEAIVDTVRPGESFANCSYRSQ